MGKEQELKKGDLYIYSDSLDPDTWGFGIVLEVKSNVIQGTMLETYRDFGRYKFCEPSKLSICSDDSRIRRLPPPATFAKNDFIFARRTPRAITPRMNVREQIHTSEQQSIMLAHVNLKHNTEAFQPRKFITLRSLYSLLTRRFQK